MLSDNEQVAKVRQGVERTVADVPCDYDFPTSLFLMRPDGTPAAFVFRPRPNDRITEWAAQTVRENLAVNAILLHCNWMPGRSGQCNDDDYREFAQFIFEGEDPCDWPGSVEVISAAVLSPDEQTWAVFGCLERSTTPASVDWDDGIAYPKAPLLDVITIELLNVQAVLNVFPRILSNVTAP